MRGKHGNQPKADKAHKWNEGRMISSHGYAKLRVGRGHPLADRNGYAYEHLVVWVSAGREKPKRNEVLNFKNDVRADCRLHNLEKITRKEHSSRILQRRGQDRLGRIKKLDGREHKDFPR